MPAAGRCETYPNMTVILCHSARGFNMHHVIESVEKLKGLENLYFDTGAVTEAGSTNALIRAFGPQKVGRVSITGDGVWHQDD